MLWSCQTAQFQVWPADESKTWFHNSLLTLLQVPRTKAPLVWFSPFTMCLTLYFKKKWWSLNPQWLFLQMVSLKIELKLNVRSLRKAITWCCWCPYRAGEKWTRWKAMRRHRERMQPAKERGFGCSQPCSILRLRLLAPCQEKMAFLWHKPQSVVFYNDNSLQITTQ